VNNKTATTQRANRQVQWVSGTNQIAFITLQESIHSDVITETKKNVHGFTLIFSPTNLARREYNSFITTFREATGTILN